jgi:hypothetical protein
MEFVFQDGEAFHYGAPAYRIDKFMQRLSNLATELPGMRGFHDPIVILPSYAYANRAG